MNETPDREPAVLLTRIIDMACGPLADRLERNRLPRLMRVNPDVYASILDLRRREWDDGYPLMFLGMELASAAGLAPDGFEFVD